MADKQKSLEYYKKLWEKEFTGENFQGALNIIEETKNLFPSSCEPFYGLTEYFIKKGNYSSALENLLRAREIKSEQPETFYLALTTVYLSLGNKLSAVEACKEGLKIHPESLEIRYMLAMSYCSLSKYDSADIVAGEAIKLNPKDIRFYKISGYISISNFEPHKAINLYQKMMENIPEEEKNALFNQGFAYYCWGKRDMAKEIWNELRKKYPEDKRCSYIMKS